MVKIPLKKRDIEGFLRTSFKLLEMSTELLDHVDGYVKDGEHILKMLHLQQSGMPDKIPDKE